MLALRRAIALIEDIGENYRGNADLLCDGYINMKDVMRLIGILVK
ncbi:MAG: hypothetical protein IKN38_04810 [Clostridia bacterium]|nr:hypothetical protein [Clostridia bacterium]